MASRKGRRANRKAAPPRWNELEKARVAAGMTQKALGELLGVDALTVSRWERGTTLPNKFVRPKLDACFPGLVSPRESKAA